MAFYETGFLYFTWPVLPLTLLFEYLLLSSILLILLHLMKVKQKSLVFKRNLLGMYVTSVGVNALLAFMFWLLSFVAGSKAIHPGDLSQPAISGDSLILLLPALLIPVCGYIKYSVYLNIILKRQVILNDKQKRSVSAALAAAVTPWLFIIPTVAAYKWLGEILLGLGRAFQ